VILASPRLQYRDSRDALVEVQVNRSKGEWNLRNPRGGDLKFIEGGRSDGGFAVVKFDRVSDRDVETFLKSFERFARERGTEIGRQEGRIIDASGKHGEQVGAYLDAQVKMLPRVGLVLCILGNNNSANTDTYAAIKHWSHVKAGIPTQCVQAGKACGKLMTSPQYHAGVLLKVNLKLGGANLHAPGPDSLALLRSPEPTMVMGFDVNHPQPGSSKPSFCALVATLDVECTKYYTAVSAQKSRTEVNTSSPLVTNFVDMVRSCVRAFNQQNGTPPKNIIFYRDGVAHNQFDAVKQTEIGQIFEACKQEGGDGYQPRLTFIVVQQRTRARFATEQLQQVTAGTLINEDVVGADGKDWYMVAQHGLKGTACPSHYHIIYDDAEHEPKHLQRLTFELCHLYARATKIVGRPAPVYYAHRAAFLAQYYKDNYHEENMFEVGSTSSHGSNGSYSSLPDIKLGEQTARTVYFA